MLRGISISSTWFTCSGTILIRRATDAPLATLKSAVSFDFLNGCRFDFLSLSPDLTSCPDRSTLFFLFQVVVTRGGMRRSASPRDAPHRIRSFLPLRLGFSSTWPTATRGNAGFNLEQYHQLTYESILHRHYRLSKRSQATLKPTKRGAASISPASGKRGWMASFNCGEGEDRRFNLAHHHQLTYKPIFHHHDRLTNRFQVIKGHFSGELRRCYRAPVGFVFLWPFTALAGQWRRQTDSPAQCAVVIGFMGPCGDRRQQFLAAEGTVVPSRRGDRRHCWPSLMPWPMPPLPPRAAGRASVPPHTRPPTHAAHLTTHQPPLDQNS